MAGVDPINDLLAENARLKMALTTDKMTASNRTGLYVAATVASAGLAVIAIVTLAIVKPDNTSTGTIVMGILLPIITAFLAASIGHLGVQVNGRLSQLLTLTEISSKAEGKLEAKADATARRVRSTDLSLPPQD